MDTSYQIDALFLNQYTEEFQRLPLQHLQQNGIDKGFAILYRGCMKPYLNASEIAKLLNVDRATVTRWIQKGIIQGVHRPSGTRQWRIPLSSYETFTKHESR